MTHSHLLLILFTLATPVAMCAQDGGRTCSKPPSCHQETACTPSAEERRREEAQARWLEAEAQRADAETQLLQAQRMAFRAEQARIQAEELAVLSAARQREWDLRRVDVKVDLLTPAPLRYHTIVLTSVTGPQSRESVRRIAEALQGHPSLEFVNPLKVRRKDRTHRRLPHGLTENEGVLRMQFHREPLHTFGRFVRMTVVDHAGRVVYEAHYENLHYGEMLAPLSGISML